MEFDIHTASSVKGPRKREGSAVYLVRALRKSTTLWQKAFRVHFDEENEEGAALLAFARAAAYIRETEDQNPEEHRTVVHIRISSGYIRDGWFWMKGWKAAGWRTAKGKPVRNRQLWQQIDKSLLGYVVVPDHPDPEIEKRLKEMTT